MSMTLALEFGKEFRGKLSGGNAALRVFGEIQRSAETFLVNQTSKNIAELAYPKNYALHYDNADYVFAANFADGSWLLGCLYGDPYLKTIAKVSSKRQTELLEDWYGTPFDSWAYISEEDRKEIEAEFNLESK